MWISCVDRLIYFICPFISDREGGGKGGGREVEVVRDTKVLLHHLEGYPEWHVEAIIT